MFRFKKYILIGCLISLAIDTHPLGDRSIPLLYVYYKITGP